MKQVLLLAVVMTTIFAKDDHLRDLDENLANATRCEDFLNDIYFSVNEIVDVDWQIFYFWHHEYEDSYRVRFTYPDTVLIDRFKAMLEDGKSNVNWTATRLFVETSIDLSGLFLDHKRPGMFRFIPAITLEYNPLPTLVFALKEIDGYLGMMNCNRRIAYLLAPMERYPKTAEEIEEIVSRFNFWNPWGRSYLVKDNATVQDTGEKSLHDDAIALDADDYVEEDIEKAQAMYQIF